MANRKFYTLLLIFMTPLLLWTEDARVLPQGTLMLSVTDLLISGSRKFDSRGDWDDTYPLTFNNLGGSLKMGITPLITIEMKWTPGINVYGNIEGQEDGDLPTLLKDRISFDGLSDLNGGIKVLLRDDSFMRTSVGLGVSIPLDKLDSDHELSEFFSGKNFRLTSQNKAEFLGIWTRFFIDFHLNENLFLNFYNQIYLNFSHTGYYKLSVVDALAIYYSILESSGDPVLAEAQAYATLDDSIQHSYALEIDLEADLHFHKSLANKSGVEFSLPLHYHYTPKTTLDGYSSDRLSGHIYTLNPSLSFNTEQFNFPLEMRLLFSFPLWGINKSQTPIMALQAKFFFDFY